MLNLAFALLVHHSPTLYAEELDLLESRTFIIAARTKESTTVREIVELSREKPEAFRESWIVFREQGGDRTLLVSQSVFNLGFLDSLLKDIRSGRTQVVEGTLIVRWSERTARFAKEDSSDTFNSQLKNRNMTGLPMVLFPRVLAFVDGEQSGRVSVHDGLNQRAVLNVLDEYARTMTYIDVSEEDVEELRGYEVVLPRRPQSVEEELAISDFVQIGLRAVLEAERRKWYEGLEPFVRDAMERIPGIDSLPRGFVPLEEVPMEFRSVIKASLRMQAEARGEVFVDKPDLRVRFILGVGAALPLPMKDGSSMNQVIQLPYRD